MWQFQTKRRISGPENKKIIKKLLVQTIRDAVAMVVQVGGTRLGKSTCTDHDVIMKSEFEPKDSGRFRDCGAREPTSSAGPLSENSLLTKNILHVSYFLLKLLWITVVPFIFLFKPQIQGRASQVPFCLGDVRLNLPESA